MVIYVFINILDEIGWNSCKKYGNLLISINLNLCWYLCVRKALCKRAEIHTHQCHRLIKWPGTGNAL